MLRVLFYILISTLLISEFARAETETSTALDPMFTNLAIKPKAATSPWPDDVSEDLNDSLSNSSSNPSNDKGETPDRDVASLKKPATKWKKKTAAKKRGSLEAKPKTSPAAASSPGRVVGRRSHLPAGVKNGFEIHVKSPGIITTFWVSQRGLRQDLLYANSGGSRASIALSPANFRVLQEHALKIPDSNTSVKACPTNNMQIHILHNGVERTSTFCVNAKSDGAEKLRNLGNTLVVWVR